MDDLRFALRSLARAPRFTAAALFTLALGMGAATAIFSLVDGLLLRPLPFADQARVVMIRESTPQNPSSSVAYPNFVDWSKRQHAFTALGAVRLQDVNITDRGDAERVAGAMVSHGFFAAVGIQPIQGRIFDAVDDRPSAARTVIVRESLCRRRLGDPASAIGQTLALNGENHVVIGVLSDTFVFPANATELWIPLGLRANDYLNRAYHPGLSVIGRLRPDTTLAAARADLAAVAEQLAREFPKTNRGSGVQLQPLTSYLFHDIAAPMTVLSIAVLCVLLIACGNVAGLLLVRASERGHEFAVRAALGASRGQITRLLLLESLLLGLGGAVGGLFASLWLVDALKATLPAATPRLAQVGVDATVLAFAGIAGLATGVAFGLAPSWRASRPDIAAELARSARTFSAVRHRFRAGLIAGQYALMVVLLLGAGLMLRTLDRLQQADLGFARDRVLTFSYDMPRYAFANGAARLEAEQRLMPRLTAVPGVVSIGYSSTLPLATGAQFNGFTVEGSGPNTSADLPMADSANISPGYFSTLGIALLRGRNFSAADLPNGPPVAIIDSVFAERHFPDRNPIGRRLKIGDATSDQPWLEIVGVVQHIQKSGAGRTSGPQLYRPANQVPGVSTVTFALRIEAPRNGTEAANRGTDAIAARVRTAFRETYPTVPVYDFQTMAERFTASIWSRRLTAVLLTVFAVLATVLAMVGLYGALAYTVRQHTREIAIRLALGADPRDLLIHVLGQGMLVAMIGIGAGLAASVGVAHALRGLLYGVSPLDPASYAVVALLATAIGLLACWRPARRAMRIDAVTALRAE